MKYKSPKSSLLVLHYRCCYHYNLFMDLCRIDILVYDNLHDIIPFNTTKNSAYQFIGCFAIRFHGAAYYIISGRGSENELV